MSSPYTIPEASPPPIPGYTLYDGNSVGVATILGGPAAGGILMAVNYRRLGKGGLAAAVLAAGLLVTALVVGLGSFIPAGLSSAVAIGLFLGIRAAAKAVQGPAVEEHVRQGGMLGSRWAAAGLGLCLLAITVAGYMAGYLLLNPKVTIGRNDEVYYSGSATKADANALGQRLKEIHFLTDRGVSVYLSKGAGGTVVSFPMQEGTWNDPEMVDGFKEVGREVATSVGGFPIKVRVTNTIHEVKREIGIGRLLIGNGGEIYYYGSATEAEAKDLGKALQSVGFFKQESSVLLSKGDATVLSFVVHEGLWDDPAFVANFQKTVRPAASTVGLFPIKLRFLNNQMETKKEVVLQ
jgi:hypothetical protein